MDTVETVIDRIVEKNKLLWELLADATTQERKREIIDILFQDPEVKA